VEYNKTSLTQKLFGNYFALSIITIFVLSLYSYNTSKSALISRTYNQLTSVKFEKERNIKNFFNERMDEVDKISHYENWTAIIEQIGLHTSGKKNADELNIPEPHINLNCGGGTQAEQTAVIMVAFEKELLTNLSDLVLVVGDVTSTMACSIVAKKLNTKVAHVEAGIRSFDLSMPEEINRMVTDALALFYNY